VNIQHITPDGDMVHSNNNPIAETGTIIFDTIMLPNDGRPAQIVCTNKGPAEVAKIMDALDKVVCELLNNSGTV